MNRWIAEVITDIQRWRALDEARSTLIAVRGRLGFDGFLYAVSLPQSLTGSSAFTLTDFPAGWIARYAEQSYFRLDPVVLHCWNSSLPYNWNELDQLVDEPTRRFLAEAGEFGLRRGVSLGFQGCEGEQALLSFSIDQTQPLDSLKSCNGIMALHALMPYVQQHIWPLIRGSDQRFELISLSEREKEALLWSAEGKTASEIASILNIAESTVVFHLKNAAVKLKVSNRSQAVAKAVLLKLITPSHAQSRVAPIKFESSQRGPKR